MAKDICAATGERIRKLRRAKGWRQIDLAEHSGVHEVHISDLERGNPRAGIADTQQDRNRSRNNALGLAEGTLSRLRSGNESIVGNSRLRISRHERENRAFIAIARGDSYAIHPPALVRGTARLASGVRRPCLVSLQPLFDIWVRPVPKQQGSARNRLPRSPDDTPASRPRPPNRSCIGKWNLRALLPEKPEPLVRVIFWNTQSFARSTRKGGARHFRPLVQQPS